MFFPHNSKSPSFSPLQSAYRKFHSTEIALFKLTNDIMETTDSGKITILTALDMSAAFDILDPITLLLRGGSSEPSLAGLPTENKQDKIATN